MNEILITCSVIAFVVLVAIAVYFHEKYRECCQRWESWNEIHEKYPECSHLWGLWNAVETEDTYMQFRQCDKCNYIEREQLRKIKSLETMPPLTQTQKREWVGLTDEERDEIYLAVELGACGETLIEAKLKEKNHVS